MSPAAKFTAAHRAAAFAVHLLTASGVPLGLLALLAAHQQRFAEMFVWLGIALVIDGIDGPLARKLEVAKVLPEWSGETLDLVVDYLNYVVVPAYALLISGVIPAPMSYVASSAIAITSALYFSDKRMKSTDGYFRGFPAAWNVIVLYLLVGKPPQEVSLLIIAELCFMTFAPFPFLHPFRVGRLRTMTVSLIFVWAALAITAIAYDLSPPQPVWIAMLLLAVYFLGAGVLRARGSISGRDD